MTPTATETPLLVNKAGAARLCAISPRSIDRLVSAGKFPPATKLGGRSLWNPQHLATWVAKGCPPMEIRT